MATLEEQKMEKARRYYQCAVCGGRLEILYSLIKHEPYLACHADQSHHGTAKEYHEKEYNIATRREFMTTKIGTEKTRALEKYSGITSLRKEEAREIIDTIWPQAGEASPAEVFKAVTICWQYGLNPLMKHVYLIPFWNKDREAYDYVAVLGIGATRLIASRKHAYSYIDDTPRLMTEDEQNKAFGEVPPSKLMAVTVLKDMKTGATVRGYGSWPKNAEPKGVDKGNSKANMAFIRSERQALDRLYPADMPKNVEVVDEQYEGTVTVEPPTQPPPGDAPAEGVREVLEPEPKEAPKTVDAGLMTPEEAFADNPYYQEFYQGVGREVAEEKAEKEVKGEYGEKPKDESPIDEGWVVETLRLVGWADITLKTWIKSRKWGVNTDAPLVKVLAALTPEQAKVVYTKLSELREAAGLTKE